MIEYRVLDDITQFEQVVTLEINVWQLDPRDAVPSHLLHAVALNGGLVVGAYDGNQIIGVAFAFPARQGNKVILWSHMAGVRPDYQGHGVGFALKQMQRQWALDHDYKIISWTYDPLQRGNANFNIHLLGATANIYHENFYGEMTDGINAGLPSDRLEVTWNLKDARVSRLSEGKPQIERTQYTQEFSILEFVADSQQLQMRDIAPDSNAVFAEVPISLTELKKHTPHLAYEWRIALRHTLQNAFAHGYFIDDFVSGEERSYYVLTCPQAWYLYVVRCSDASLYTGITVDLDRRVAQHNAGRGAAYTATRRPVTRIATWRFQDRRSALKAEAAFKKLSRSQKDQIIERRSDYQDAPFYEIESP